MRIRTAGHIWTGSSWRCSLLTVVIIPSAVLSVPKTVLTDRRLIQYPDNEKHSEEGIPFAPLREHTEIRLEDYTPHAQERSASDSVRRVFRVNHHVKSQIPWSEA